MSDEAQDRMHEACISFGLPPGLDPALLAEKLRPVMPRQLRSLTLEEDHFQSDAFGQRTFNELMAYIFVGAEAHKILKDSRSPNWNFEIQCKRVTWRDHLREASYHTQ